MVSEFYTPNDHSRGGRNAGYNDPWEGTRNQLWGSQDQQHHNTHKKQHQHAKPQTHHNKPATHKPESKECPPGQEQQPQAKAHDYTAADNVAKQFQDAQKSGDYSKASLALGQLQRKDGTSWAQDRDRINNQMHQSGTLPDLSIVGTDDKGRVLTRDSKNTGVIETREPVHMNEESRVTDTSHKETRGGREFDVNADGSSSYVAKNNSDNDWTVTKSALTQDGKAPTNQEIANTVNAMADQSGKTLKQMGIVHDGDRIDVPAPAPGGTGDFQHKQPAQKLEDDPYHQKPLSPPGTGDNNVREEKQTGTTTNADGTTTYSEGHLNDSNMRWATSWLTGDKFGNPTGFQKQETRDQQGRLTDRQVKYDNAQTITVQAEDGSMKNVSDVKQVNTKFNGYSGQYETTYTNSKGEKTMIRTNNDGSTLAGPPKPDPAANILPGP